MENNHSIVAQGFRSLLGALAPYIALELSREFGKDWWSIAVIDKLYDDQKRDLPAAGDWGTLVDALDIQRCLLLFDLHWNQVFRKRLSIDHRTWAKELIGVRNRLAHIGGQDFSDDDTWRALDTMARLCEQLDPENAEEIRGLLRVSRYGSALGSTTVVQTGSVTVNKPSKNIGILNQKQLKGLPS